MLQIKSPSSCSIPFPQQNHLRVLKTEEAWNTPQKSDVMRMVVRERDDRDHVLTHLEVGGL